VLAPILDSTNLAPELNQRRPLSRSAASYQDGRAAFSADHRVLLTKKIQMGEVLKSIPKWPCDIRMLEGARPAKELAQPALRMVTVLTVAEGG
jgi:hypothetical protein